MLNADVSTRIRGPGTLGTLDYIDFRSQHDQYLQQQRPELDVAYGLQAGKLLSLWPGQCPGIKSTGKRNVPVPSLPRVQCVPANETTGACRASPRPSVGHAMHAVATSLLLIVCSGVLWLHAAAVSTAWSCGGRGARADSSASVPIRQHSVDASHGSPASQAVQQAYDGYAGATAVLLQTSQHCAETVATRLTV